MIVIDKLLFKTKKDIPVRFVFEFGNYIYETYDLYGRFPKYAFGFCLALVYKADEPRGGYKFLKNYLGVIL